MQDRYINSTVLIYACHENSEIERTIHNSIKRLKYLGINLTKEVQNLYLENKLLLQSILKDLINGKTSNVHDQKA